jgi:hypothetical protein
MKADLMEKPNRIKRYEAEAEAEMVDFRNSG